MTFFFGGVACPACPETPPVTLMPQVLGWFLSWKHPVSLGKPKIWKKVFPPWKEGSLMVEDSTRSWNQPFWKTKVANDKMLKPLVLRVNFIQTKRFCWVFSKLIVIDLVFSCRTGSSSYPNSNEPKRGYRTCAHQLTPRIQFCHVCDLRETRMLSIKPS